MDYSPIAGQLTWYLRCWRTDPMQTASRRSYASMFERHDQLPIMLTGAKPANTDTQRVTHISKGILLHTGRRCQWQSQRKIPIVQCLSLYRVSNKQRSGALNRWCENIHILFLVNKYPYLFYAMDTRICVALASNQTYSPPCTPVPEVVMSKALATCDT